MKIGLRTIKTVISVVLGILIASALGLASAPTAGIIALLSVSNTKKSSLELGVGRILAFIGAVFIAWVCYNLIGYNAYAFGVYLLVYIPLAVKFNVSEAITVNSVLMTSFLNAKSMTLPLIGNAFGLLIIGISLAWLANLYMPNQSQKLADNKKSVDEKIQTLILELAGALTAQDEVTKCETLLAELSHQIENGEAIAKKDLDNHLLSEDVYHLNYFQMRRLQWTLLADILLKIKKIDVSAEISEDVVKLMERIATEYAETNDAKALKEAAQNTMAFYQASPLPKTRTEFENRALLFLLLQDLETFVSIKVNFFAESSLGE